MTGGPPLDREAMGALKVRLRNDPADATTRADIVRVYRSLGHLDQAGRYAIGLDEGARRDELSAYAGMVRGLGADEKRVRTLSLLPSDRELPEKVRKAIEAGPFVDDWRPWGVVVGFAWGAVFLVASIAVFVVYAAAMLGADDIQGIARTWTLVTGCAMLSALALGTVWCASSSKWRATLIWGGITALFGVFLVLAVIAVAR